MKIAGVVPILKEGDHKITGNYHPISILPAISTILERSVAN